MNILNKVLNYVLKMLLLQILEININIKFFYLLLIDYNLVMQ